MNFRRFPNRTSRGYDSGASHFPCRIALVCTRAARRRRPCARGYPSHSSPPPSRYGSHRGSKISARSRLRGPSRPNERHPSPPTLRESARSEAPRLADGSNCELSHVNSADWASKEPRLAISGSTRRRKISSKRLLSAHHSRQFEVVTYGPRRHGVFWAGTHVAWPSLCRFLQGMVARFCIKSRGEGGPWRLGSVPRRRDGHFCCLGSPP